MKLLKMACMNSISKKNEVKINIIDHGNAGVFGFFEKEAEVEITPLSPLELKVKKLIPYLIGKYYFHHVLG